MSDTEKSDIEKAGEAEHEPQVEAASAPPAAAATAASNGAKQPTFLDKLSLFTIGKNRGELPAEKGI